MIDIGVRESVGGPVPESSVEVVGVASRRRFTADYKRGFSALPGGYRGAIGNFNTIGYDASFWSSTELSSFGAWGRGLGYNFSQVSRFYNNKQVGFSVRCVRD